MVELPGLSTSNEGWRELFLFEERLKEKKEKASTVCAGTCMVCVPMQNNGG